MKVTSVLRTLCAVSAFVLSLAWGQQQRPVLQELIDQAQPGEVLLIPPGTYAERLLVQGKTLSIVAGRPNPKNPRELIPGGHPFDHVITSPDGLPGPSLVTIIGGEETKVFLEGFTLTKGWAQEGGAVSVRGAASALMSRCVLRQNLAEAVGGAVFVEAEATCVLGSCALLHNEAQQDGAALFFLPSPRPLRAALASCTVTANRGGHAAVFLGNLEGADPCLFSNILLGNQTPLDAASPTLAFIHYSAVGRLENLVCEEGCLVGAQIGFQNIEVGNFRLAPRSPGIDAGYANPPCFPFFLEVDFEGDPPFDDPDTPNTGGGDVEFFDMGADEYLPVFIRADANADGAVDIGDPVSVLDYLFRLKPLSCDDAVDGNDDGALDIADAVYALSYLFAGGPPPPMPFPTLGTDPTPDSLYCAYYGAYPSP